MAKRRKPKRKLADDPLVLTGFALEAARHLHGRLPTREEVEELRQELAGQEDTLSDEDRRLYREIGKLDPRPVLERLKQAVTQLQRKVGEGLVGPVLSAVAELELILALRRFGGRPREARHKVTEEQVEAIRKWYEGRRRRTRPTVSEFAKSLGLSRQTVYTVLAELQNDQPAQQE